MVSIIIPCYNIEKHVTKCIDSVLNQSFVDFELLLINDGSTDHTGDACEKYAEQDSRIKVFHQKNAGVSAARNLGLQQATGDLLIFIDGDDYIKKDYIEQLVNNYVEGNWLICGMINVRNENPIDNKDFQSLLDIYPQRIMSKSNFIDLLKYYSFSSPCARIYSAKIIKDNNLKFNVNVTYQEDLLFNLEYVQFIEQVKLVDYFGYCYVAHSESSTTGFHESFKQGDQLLKLLLEYCEKSGDHRILQEFIFQTVMREISNIMHEKSPKEKKQKIEEIKVVLKSTSYQFIQSYIKNSTVNSLLKKLLFLRKSTLIYYYYNFSK